jgi:hypothetical protein
MTSAEAELFREAARSHARAHRSYRRGGHRAGLFSVLAAARRNTAAHEVRGVWVDTHVDAVALLADFPVLDRVAFRSERHAIFSDAATPPHTAAALRQLQRDGRIASIDELPAYVHEWTDAAEHVVDSTAGSSRRPKQQQREAVRLRMNAASAAVYLALHLESDRWRHLGPVVRSALVLPTR